MREIAKLSAHTLKNKNGKKVIDSGEGRVWIVVSILPFLFVWAMWKTGNHVSRQGQDWIYAISLIFSLVSFYKLVNFGLVIDDVNYSPTLMYSVYGIAILFVLVAAIGNSIGSVKMNRYYQEKHRIAVELIDKPPSHMKKSKKSKIIK